MDTCMITEGNRLGPLILTLNWAVHIAPGYFREPPLLLPSVFIFRLYLSKRSSAIVLWNRDPPAHSGSQAKGFWASGMDKAWHSSRSVALLRGILQIFTVDCKV